MVFTRGAWRLDEVVGAARWEVVRILGLQTVGGGP
jgi:hypothetical protein